MNDFTKSELWVIQGAAGQRSPTMLNSPAKDTGLMRPPFTNKVVPDKKRKFTEAFPGGASSQNSNTDASGNVDEIANEGNGIARTNTLQMKK